MTYENPTPNPERKPDILMPASQPVGDPAAAKTRRSLGWTVAVVAVLLVGGYAVIRDHGTAQNQGVIAGARTANGDAAPLQGVGAPWGSSAASPAQAPAPSR